MYHGSIFGGDLSFLSALSSSSLFKTLRLLQSSPLNNSLFQQHLKATDSQIPFIILKENSKKTLKIGGIPRSFLEWRHVRATLERLWTL